MHSIIIILINEFSLSIRNHLYEKTPVSSGNTKTKLNACINQNTRTDFVQEAAKAREVLKESNVYNCRESR